MLYNKKQVESFNKFLAVSFTKPQDNLGVL